ncbi:MAG: hypothetical protein HQ518_08180 [Rhodopirellula sp.]|nr:hypothetical protein [Rhodopirellula sp.]
MSAGRWKVASKVESANGDSINAGVAQSDAETVSGVHHVLPRLADGISNGWKCRPSMAQKSVVNQGENSLAKPVG